MPSGGGSVHEEPGGIVKPDVTVGNYVEDRDLVNIITAHAAFYCTGRAKLGLGASGDAAEACTG